MSTVIEAAGLEKRFGNVQALDGLDLTVTQGEVHGFLGPNGAGKSTTIRILLGLSRASGGQARVFGQDPWASASAIHARLAYVPGDVALWSNLSGGESIDLISRLRGTDTSAASYRERRAQLAEAFQFDPRKKARTYSKGNRQKVALIAAFASPAELYILDEPTSGLDPVMEAVFTEEIKRVAADGASVLLSSHILSEVEALCDRVSIIRTGRTVESGTLGELRHLTRTEISCTVEGLEGAALLAAFQAALSGIPSVHDLAATADRVHFSVDSAEVAGVLPPLGRLRVQSLTVSPPSLEELFLRHYGDEISSAEDSLTAAAR
ncbi:ABC transporter ATP-binding protein [Psychromicrobium xiongbiense]|uniref:ABC transporter ATP-binding protein n=1 Tax=Psychromicrobium xiongbiense TaxID=3051184 RepID=UPI002553CB34|nr:ABC transporter ATP-binding protein [Psychromicrobium sp. YIM S02556]